MDKINNLFDFERSVPFSDLHFKSDPKTGLQAIIAIHSTKLGPAFGGCRFIDYPTTDAAITDALRLARGMSYKNAISGLSYGGGKSVIIKPKQAFDRPAFFTAFGHFVAELGGRYITAKDSGTLLEDMDTIAKVTPYVSSTSNISDPSPFTAHGIRRGIEAAVKFRLGKDHLDGVKVAIQGAGSVGYYLAKELHALGAQLIVSDVNPKATARCAEEFGATVVTPDEIYQVDCDVFSPCALGAIINDTTIPLFKASIIAGGANNQLAEIYHGEELAKREILYAPDYAINAGGVIQAAIKYEHGSDETIKQKIHNLYYELLGIFERAAKFHLPTSVVADHIAEERL